MNGRLLYIDYQMYGKNDIIEAFQILGYDVSIVDYPVRYGEESEKTRELLESAIVDGDYDMVFTSNYYPMVSNICHRNELRYISWTYDSPRIALYDQSIMNSCNYAFVFDGDECKALKNKGVTNVYYMPLGVNTDRVNAIKINSKDNDTFSSDVSIVASLYDESHNLYDRIYRKLDDYTCGYLDAVVNAQRNVFGANVIEESLHNDIVRVMYNAMPYDIAEDSLADHKYIYANYFVARKAAEYQRKDFIKAISEKYKIKVYTPGNISDIPRAIHMGTVDYETDMNKVFQLSKINLNITLPSIKSGIPLRMLDIMGAGGFLLSDYRQDSCGIFEPGVDYVCYTDINDVLLKIEYYLDHDEERNNIALSGKKKVEQCFSYIDRIKDMLEIVMN